MIIINIEAYQESLFIWLQIQQKCHIFNSCMPWAAPLPRVHIITQKNPDSTEKALWVHTLNINNQLFFLLKYYTIQTRKQESKTNCYFHVEQVNFPWTIPGLHQSSGLTGNFADVKRWPYGYLTRQKILIYHFKYISLILIRAFYQDAFW